MIGIFSEYRTGLAAFVIVLVIFFLGIFIAFISSLFNSVADSLMPGLNEQGQEVLEAGRSNYSSTFDMVIIVLFFSFLLALLIFSYYMSHNPFYLALLIFIMFISVWISFSFQTWWIDNIASDANLLPEDTIPMTNWLLSNITYILTSLVFVNGLIMYLGSRRDIGL